MAKRKVRKKALICGTLVATGALLTAAVYSSKVAPQWQTGTPSKGPRLVIWSWEHDDNLRFIHSGDVAVAYYAGTITLGRDTASLARRKNFLRLSEGTAAFPVFRIELAHPHEEISDLAFTSACNLVIDYLQQHPGKEVQIDFDAGARDRKPYLAFLRNLKSKLPAQTALSITALGSWCLYDKWLQQAPVNETVAMMFSLGKDSRETLAALENHALDSGAPCQQSIGIALNERQTNSILHKRACIKQARRVYAFSPMGWTKSRYEEIVATVEKGTGEGQ
ncbi:MAG: DUF3142 domain-containing protein [Cyanobacteria bacterium SZAS LIN-3]|nr:DUF3142 domain-containing protein [Cyanobacteria bacterium SZAS LIN-3]MBS2006707.1 DUF3142 domain-containing protein [Cyanobacteria bacterium SZAS TMP-1]